MRADGILEAIRKIYGAVLDRLDIGVILLDATGHPAFVNTRAADIAARGDGLNASRAGVAASLPAETRALQAAIAATAAEAAAPATAAGNVGSRRVYLSRPSGLSPLAVTVVAVTDIGGGDGQEARLALFIDDPEAPTRIDTSGLGAAYGLTPREAAVAALLSRGSDVTQAAKTLGIGVSSTRQYLKRVLDKTGTRRQANLVRLVLRSFAHSYG